MKNALTTVLRSLLDQHGECARRVSLGREIAAHYRWQIANDLLVAALSRHDA